MAGRESELLPQVSFIIQGNPKTSELGGLLSKTTSITQKAESLIKSDLENIIIQPLNW